MKRPRVYPSIAVAAASAAILYLACYVVIRTSHSSRTKYYGEEVWAFGIEGIWIEDGATFVLTDADKRTWSGVARKHRLLHAAFAPLLWLEHSILGTHFYGRDYFDDL